MRFAIVDIKNADADAVSTIRAKDLRVITVRFTRPWYRRLLGAPKTFEAAYVGMLGVWIRKGSQERAVGDVALALQKAWTRDVELARKAGE